MNNLDNFGYPLSLSPLARAKLYAADARARNQPPCDCDRCKTHDKQEAVIRIVSRYKLAPWSGETFMHYPSEEARQRDLAYQKEHADILPF